jgi:hypothetical protein
LQTFALSDFGRFEMILSDEVDGQQAEQSPDNSREFFWNSIKAVGGSLKSNLKQSQQRVREFHQRQLVVP